MKKKVYISGPITGTEDYMERFAEAEEMLKSRGYSVINPSKVNAQMPEDTTYEQYMQMSIAMMNIADAIYLLPGWNNSRGASFERHYSDIIGLEYIERMEEK
ncbi:DUF4406 domain-containing protein [Bacteroides heparinolyticus]|uniref:DUF4406 domain-containing protein n=1 Tax=Prevotella heparinolytica TaxID=28113 RepID=UPI0035A1D074